MTRHFLTGEELTGQELGALLDRADALKEDRRASGALAGRSVALLFEKPSTRTRISFEVGVHELGGHPIVLRESELQLARGESPRDTARVLSRYVDAVGIRAGAHATVVELAESSRVPVINMLTPDHHPCQALADLLTLRERFGRLEGIRLAYVGDGNNVAHSLMVLGAAAGVEVVVATPAELRPHLLVPQVAGATGSPGGSVSLTQDPAAAAEGAHALYTDVWVSMGDEALMGRARPDAIALHCLPAHPGEEISESLLYGERSAVWDQAENRLHTQKALLEMLVADGGEAGSGAVD